MQICKLRLHVHEPCSPKTNMKTNLKKVNVVHFPIGCPCSFVIIENNKSIKEIINNLMNIQ